MTTLTGRFILDSGKLKVNPFAGSLLYECTDSSEQIIVNPQYDACINPSQQTVLKGRFLDSTLRGMKVFEAYSAIRLSEVVTIQPSTETGIEVAEYFVGTVTFLSQCFKLKNGPTVFLTLLLSASSRSVRLMLLLDAVQWAQFLHVGDTIEVNNVVRFRWKTSQLDTSQSQSGISQNPPITQDTASSDSQQKSYYVDHPRNVSILQQGTRFATTISKNSNTISTNDLIRPESLLQKEQYANMEFSYLTGTIRSVHITGCLELVNVTLYSVGTGLDAVGKDNAPDGDDNDSVDKHVDIYDVDSYPSDGFSASQPATTNNNNNNTTTTIQLPHAMLYLSQHTLHHLRLTALGVSVRKTATVLVHNIIPAYLYGTNKGFTTTCRSNLQMLRFANNAHFLCPDALHCSININVCKEYKNSCVLYTVWREETRRKLAHCVQIDMQQQSQVYEDVVLHIESLATFVSTNNVVENKTVPGKVRNLLTLPPIAVPDELYSLSYTQLYTIRNGLDGDYIGNNLPQVYSVTTVLAKLHHIHTTSNIYCHANVYGLFQYDLCSVQQNYSYWNQYNHPHNNSRPMRKKIVLLGTVVSVSVPKVNQFSSHQAMLCVRVCTVDTSGKSIVVVINNVGAEFVAYLHTICSARLTRVSNEDKILCSRCNRYQHHSTTTNIPTTNELNMCITYCALCVCNTHLLKPPLHTNKPTASPLSTSVVHNPLYLSVHYPVGLVEQQPTLSHFTEGADDNAEHKYLIVADAINTKFLNVPEPTHASAPLIPTISGPTANPTPVQPTTTIRQILTTNLGQYKHKYVPSLSCIVVNKQVLTVEYKNGNNNNAQEYPTTSADIITKLHAHNDGEGSTSGENKYKKRRLVTQYSVSESVEYSDRLNNITTSSSANTTTDSTAVNTAYNAYSLSVYKNTTTASTTTTNHTSNSAHTAKKCCLMLRDVNYPDTINLYIPLSYVTNATVGQIVCITDLYACIPESKKKMYLKLTEENKTRIDILGMASGAQLQTLCELSRTIPDPRFIDTMYTHNVHHSVYNGSIGMTGPIANTNNPTTKYTIPYTAHSIYEHYIHAPPPTTISQLTPQCNYNRAVYTLTGQVTFIRKLHITLRCTNCSSSAKRCNRLGGYMCTKCTACYTIMPLWEVYIAFDDGTGECNMHIEGEQVFNVIRAKYDMCSKILSQVRKLVDNYVHKYGSLLYDAFDQSVSEYNKPYSEVVQATYNATNAVNTNADGSSTAATANTAATLQYTSRSNMIFDMPLSERTNCLVSFIDLTTNKSNTKIPLILRSYIQLASYSTQFSIYCRVDYNTGTSIPFTTDNTPLTTTTSNNNTTKSKREVKLQRNNADKPYLAYFVSRPTYSGTKLSMQGLFARELHGESLNNKSWELLKKLQN